MTRRRSSAKSFSLAQEQRLIRQAQHGNQAAKKRLLLAHNHAIVKSAFRFISTRRHTIRMLEVANLAFLHAIDTYRPTPRSRFWPHALRGITHALTNARTPRRQRRRSQS